MTKLYLYGAIALVIISGVIGYTVYERHQGAAACQMDDLKAAQKQLQQQAKDIAAYQTQLKDANDELAKMRAAIANAASAPVPHLVCHQASPQHLPVVPGAPPAGVTASGTPDPVRDADFDPGPDLRRLSVGYELRFVAPAIDALNRWPKGK